MTELVSVILATRNRAASLQRALASIQRQTHPNLEILVLDDGSTDGTFALLEKLPRTISGFVSCAMRLPWGWQAL